VLLPDHLADCSHRVRILLRVRDHLVRPGRALTGGRTGIHHAPTVVFYDFMFQRSELGRGSARRC